MASKYKTPNVGLNNWVSTDKPTMEDFNNDNAKLDSTIGEIKSYFPSGDAGYAYFYVDQESTAVKEDGSVAFPFKSLQKACRFLSQKQFWSTVYLYLNNGRYDIDKLTLRNIPSEVVISPKAGTGENIPNITINCIDVRISNCKSLTFNNIKFNSIESMDFIITSDSNIYFNFCEIMASRPGDSRVALWTHRSTVMLVETKIGYNSGSGKFAYGIYANNSSNITFRNKSSIISASLGFYAVASMIFNEKATCIVTAPTTHAKGIGGQIFE